MAFNSFIFWIVFPLLFLLYWAIPGRYMAARKWYLIVVSYWLYMNWKPAFALVLLYVTLVTFYGAKYVAAIKENGKRKRSLISVLAVMALLPLFLFKYYAFINENITAVMSWLHIQFSFPGLNWAIPVGISFFTFQALGYLFDVYRGKELPETSFSDYALFCSFFPQIASGPISTASELLPQIKSRKTFSYADGVQGLKWVLWGIFLKCVVADRMGLYVDVVFSGYSHFSSANCMWAAVLYTIQIYADFAGYSLMAIGIARTLGFRLINNFNRPYFAESITQFWRRWHISLTRWLTTHVYIPLGGSRCSKPRQYANIMCTFLVSGLWHGASWSFVAWGALHGGLQIGEKSLGLDPKGRHSGKRWLKRIKPLRIVITFVLVTVAWVFFRMPTLGEAIGFLGHIFTDSQPQPFMFQASNTDKLLTFLAIVLLFCAEVRAEYLSERTRWMNASWFRWTAYVSLFCIILALGVLTSGSFIYANF